jgi:drug/metabolite transporter (DMT)-like permease
MRRYLGTAHRTVGIATLALFAVTGQIMDQLHLNQMAVDSAARLLYRSRHIYLLFAGLVNLAVGMRFVLPISGTGSRVAVIGSILMLVAPVPLTVAFFVEPPKLGQVTLPAILGIFGSYIGLLFYCVSIWRLRVRDALAPGRDTK